MSNLKTVTVVIPCFNEEKYITYCLDSLLANDYDKRFLEIIVVDGMSTDKTREILAAYCHQYRFVKVLDNPKRIIPAAVNIGIKYSKSDVFLRVDAHAEYAPDYISKLVNGLEKYQADNIGGIRETAIIKDTLLSLALSISISHPFTAGNAYYRIGSKRVRQVDTVWCGCFRREIFEKIGYFNENILRAEDRDFNARLTANGGKIILDPAVKCTYFPRTNFWEYIKWNISGPFHLFNNHKYTNTNMVLWRNMVPAMFVLSQFAAVAAFTFSSILGLLFSLPFFIYLAVATFLSLKISYKYNSVLLAPVMLVVFAITHYGYGFGSLFGMPSFFLQRWKKLWK